MQPIKLYILFKYHSSECNSGRNVSVRCYIFYCSGHNHGAIMTLQVLLMDTCMPILSENVHMHNDEFLYFLN